MGEYGWVMAWEWGCSVLLLPSVSHCPICCQVPTSVGLWEPGV